MIVFGGTDGSSELQSSAAYMGDQWSDLVAANAPPAERRLHAAVWDDVASRMIVFGGLGFDPNSGTITSLSTGGIYDDEWFELAQIGKSTAPLELPSTPAASVVASRQASPRARGRPREGRIRALVVVSDDRPGRSSPLSSLRGSGC